MCEVLKDINTSIQGLSKFLQGLLLQEVMGIESELSIKRQDALGFNR